MLLPDFLTSTETSVKTRIPDTLSELPIEIKRTPRARRVALRLDIRARRFVLVIPKRMSERKAYEFARRQKSWMQDKLDSLPKRVQFIHGNILPVFGRDRRINICRDNAPRATSIDLEPDCLYVKTKLEQPENRITRFLKSESLRQLEILSHEKADMINLPVRQVKVRDTKSRWGSCSPTGNLSYSWRLIFAPYDVLDYIVAHEVAHLKHPDHSAAFWRVCASLSRNEEKARRWLRENGAELMRYG